MCSQKQYPLSLGSDTFNGLKCDFDTMLKQLISEMSNRDSEEATMTIKLTVKLENEQARDFATEDAMRDIKKPSFKHEINTVMQVKNKKSGGLSGNYELVWDRDLCQYVMREIDDGQTSLFDKTENEKEEIAQTPYEPAALPCPDENVIDADYVEVDDCADSESQGVASEMTPYDFLKQFIGKRMRVLEAHGVYTVRTEDNAIVLSSGVSPTKRFYISEQMASNHVDHNLICAAYGFDGQESDNISIECEDCNEVLFSMDRDEGTSISDYEYTEPEE